MDANTIGLIVVVVVQLINILVAWRTREDVHKIEVATNSMKDALIVSTAKASKAEGREEMRVEQKATGEPL